MEFLLLKDIVIILALSTLVNLVFTRLKIPTVVGYLLTGILAGPYVLALVHGEKQIENLAEIGVIFLLFTIGMEFSLRHLLKIRQIVFVGGLLQVVLTAGLFYLVSVVFGLPAQTAIFIGVITALSSSALVLKLLQERSELTSNYGRTILGILIFQDLLLVPLLLFANLLGNGGQNVSGELMMLLVKAILIIGLVYAGNKWLLPNLLQWVAFTKNQELFMMTIFLVCLSVALLTSQLGMSLAFGAFLAGLMISESPYSHNAFSNLIPFKDSFTSFFFVSIGMLLDLSFVAENYLLILFSVLMVILLKTLIAGTTAFVLGHTFRGVIMVGIALSQVGEFSFILARVGLNNAILNPYYYQLFLAVAIITMAVTPFIMKYSLSFANTMLKLPLPAFLVNGIFPLKEIDIPNLNNHLVIIGKDSSALKLGRMAKLYGIGHVSIIFDPLIAKEKIKNKEQVVYGDAVNEPILLKAHVDTSDVVVISVGSVIPSMAIIEKVRSLSKTTYIIARTKTIEHVEQLYKLGADQVLPEKLEIAIDFFNRVLVRKLFPNKEVTRILTQIRSLSLGEFSEKDIVNQPTILDELPNVNIVAIQVEEASKADGHSLSEIKLRTQTGVTLLAIRRGKEVIEHPTPDTAFQAKDVLYVLGDHEQVLSATDLFTN
ncbi:MAG TPA: cation:proton antiporter [Draconibacterium sp.]|nr:cation:proton antiporter [Draconibacterium sp.]